MRLVPSSTATKLTAAIQARLTLPTAIRTSTTAKVNTHHCAFPPRASLSRRNHTMRSSTYHTPLELAPAGGPAVPAMADGQSWYHPEALSVDEEPIIHDHFDAKTGSWQYVVADPSSKSAVIIDPVLDYDPVTGIISTSNADRLLALIKEGGYRIDSILETHAHADHMTAASYLQKRLGEIQGIDIPFIGIGKRIVQVQRMFGEKYNIPVSEYENVFDKLFDDDEEFHVGGMKALAIHIPGHTPDHMGYMIGNNVFVGDSVFHIDLGSARADFPGGSAEALFASGRRLFRLPDHVRLWIGHDYPPPGRDVPVSSMTVRDHKEQNKHLKGSVDREEFVELRKARDATLAQPKLIHSSLQVNIRAGRLPKPTKSGQFLMHQPLLLQEVEPW